MNANAKVVWVDLDTPEMPLFTAEAFHAQYDIRRAELVAGVVRERSARQPDVAAVLHSLARHVGAYVEQNHCGYVLGSGLAIKLPIIPDTVYGPDLGFYTNARLPIDGLMSGLLTVTPTIAFEIRSPAETWQQMYAKTAAYLQAGTPSVMILDTPAQTVIVFHSDASPDTFTATQDLTFPDVLPGFAVRVGSLFA